MATTYLRAAASPKTRGVFNTVAGIAISIAGTLAVVSGGCKKTTAVDDGQKTTAANLPPPSAPSAAAIDTPKAVHPPRRLEDVNRRELEATLPRGAPVEITAPDGDVEAYRLAQEIRIFLRSEKYGVANIIRRPPDPSAKGVGLEPLPGGKWRVIVGEPE
jgi:hypothetical protein